VLKHRAALILKTKLLEMKPVFRILPSVEELKFVLDYNPDTGHFTWKARQLDCNTRRPRAGKIAGSTYGSGHRVIRVNKIRYMAHRLAWAMFYKEEPPPLIDHRNGNPADNRIANLREATRAQNAINSKLYRNSKSGIKGVAWNNLTKKWTASICVGGKSLHLGSFDDRDSAAAAYLTVAKSLHGDFVRA